jgi:eukaryotic-like serine/threonine-protein kinase
VIGQTLGGRYEILERVGGGGMALVYKGQDLLLNRKVAVKILRQQYVHDEEFIRRFRREAQSAASLSHPNVVSIYDVGQEDEIHYIVMEYIEGITLNDLIKQRAPMQVEEAINIASQICDALDHAHHNGIIHRDIKPHNILIGRNGRVKVTDFGIARAASSSSITQTGSVIGSVHYFSPEHAKGTQAGEMSDLYSLGIVLYQMLTGKLPFSGESPISVALKHLQENVEAPRSVNPLIPQSVENLILKSMRKRPEERYQAAKEMMKDLETCLLPERRNEAKLQQLTQDYPEDMDDESTRIIPAIRPHQYTNPPKNETYTRPVYNNQNEDDEDDYDYEDEDQPKKKAWLKPTIWIVVLLAVLGGMFGLYKAVEGIFVVDVVKMPNLVGKPQSEAENILTNLKLTYKIDNQPSEQPVKEVIKTYPPADMEVKVGNEVTLYVSMGPDQPKMPSVRGQNLKDALAQLAGLGVDTDTQVKIDPVFSDDAKDTVLQQEPGLDQSFDPKTVQIKLTVSQGKDTIKVPNLVNKTVSEAKAELERLELKFDEKRNTTAKNNDVPKGKIIKQFPHEANEEVQKGTAIYVIVSEGPDEVLRTKVSVPLTPSVAGQSSEFKVLLTDDTGNDKQMVKKSISTEETVDVPVIVSPNKSITITIYENDFEVNTITKKYDELKQ